MSGPRRITSFSSIDGLQEVTFPGLNYQWAPQQRLRNTTARVVGADYAVDLLGRQAAAKDIGQEAVTFALAYDDVTDLDTAWDALRAALTRIGRGKLWSTGHNAIELSMPTRRWAWARAASLAEAQFNADTQLLLPVSVSFDRLSDWFAEDETTVTESVITTPHSFTLTNNGNAPVRGVVFRFRSNTVSGFNAPTITNLTTGESFSSTRVAAGADDELRVDCGRYAVEYSTDDGLSYSGDYANFSTGSTQVAFMTLQPGANSIQVTNTGTPNYSLEIEFSDTFH